MPAFLISVCERLAKHRDYTAQNEDGNFLLPPGFEPGIAVPKTAVISISPRELCGPNTSRDYGNIQGTFAIYLNNRSFVLRISITIHA